MATLYFADLSTLMCSLTFCDQNGFVFYEIIYPFKIPFWFAKNVFILVAKSILDSLKIPLLDPFQNNYF
jgi:hypothetical protein